jgi:phenylacetate-CoA ligase
MRTPEIEAMDRGELELLQLERLQSTLTRAYRQVKFYRRQFDRLGLNLDDFRSLSDLTRLPCTTREDLSENYPYGLFAVPLRDIVRILSSPGTTEKPLVVGYAAQDIKLWPGFISPRTSPGKTSCKLSCRRVWPTGAVTSRPGPNTWGPR